MNKEEIVAIAVRLFAIALALYSFSNLPGMAIFYDQMKMPEATYLFAGLTLSIFIIAILLWTFPLTVARKILPKSSSNSKIGDWSYEGILTCGFIILGIYFLYHAISDSMYWLYIWKYSESFEGNRIKLNTDQLAQIYATMAEFIFTMILIFGSKALSGFLVKLRHAGLDSKK
jgi:hypothetical protein